MTAVRHWTSVEVRALRLALRITQAQLAKRINRGTRTVAGWESTAETTQPPSAAQAALDDLLIRATEVERIRFQQLVSQPSLVRRPSATAHRTRDAPALIPVTNPPRRDRHRALLSSIAEVASAAGLLTPGDAAVRRIGATDVERINAIISLYQSIDREYGGGLLYREMARFAESVSSLLLHSYRDAIAPGLLTAVSSARQLAGWTAFDACRHADAQRHFLAAERVAVAAHDPLLAARVRYSQARQYQHLRHNEDALTVLRLALDHLGQAATPAVTAILHGATAASWAALGAHGAATASLTTAQENFDRIAPDHEPTWVRFFDRGELLAQYGRVYRDFARANRRHAKAAVQWVTQALPAYNPQAVRSTVLGEVSLCSALFLNDEPDEAVAVGARVIMRAEQLTSPRVLDRVRNLRRDLDRHLHLPDVADFAHAVHTTGPATA